MKKRIVMGVGEVLWDVFDDIKCPGGAPANVAFLLNQLGMCGIILSRVGNDDLGRELIQYLDAQNVSTEFIQYDSSHPTGLVTVELDVTGTPSYIIHENTAWDFLEWTPALETQLATVSAICFGTLAQRNPTTHATIHRILDTVPSDCLKVYDVNLRQHFFSKELLEASLRKANIVKMNIEELEVLQPILNLASTATVTQCALELCEKYAIQKVCITRASEGCLLVKDDGQTADIPGHSIDVVDTVGSGDAFTAALIVAVLSGCTLQTQAEFANDVGTLVATQAGGMPQIQKELCALKDRYNIK